MTQLIDRDVAITVGTLRIASRDEVGIGQAVLRMMFDVVKSNKRDPNKASLKIYNLSESSRSKIEYRDTLPTIIEAGYVGTLAQIFTGDLRFGSSSKQGVDWITTLEAGDGSSKYRSARVSKSFSAGTLVTDALKSAVESMGIGTGNLDKVLAAGSKRALKVFGNGTVLSGKSSDVIDELVKSMGLEWSIQDGQVEILGQDETTQDEAVLLTPATGLVGSPAIGEKGNLKARSLLQPDIAPGKKVQIESAAIFGSFFKVTKVRHSGDTWGNNWFTDLEGKPVT